MSETQQQQVVKKSKKDTKVLEQWADTKDPFVNQLYKRLRNAQKKLNKFKEVEQKIKKGEIQPSQEQLESLSRKDKVKAEMDETLGYLNLYKESFPENPAFASGKKKGEEKPAAEAAPVVDNSKAVEGALSLLADVVLFSSVELKSSSQNMNNAIKQVAKTISGLIEGAGSLTQAKSNFVDTVSNLVAKSASQVGNSSVSFKELNEFVSNLSSTEGQTILSTERVVAPVEEPVAVTTTTAAAEVEAATESAEAVPEEEEKGASGEEAEVASPGEQKEGEETGLLGEEGKAERGARGGRGNRGRGNRGGYFKKHKQDEEGFEVVREGGDNHQNHFASRRQRGAYRGSEHHRGGFRGGEHRGTGEYRGGDRGTRGPRGGRGGEGRPFTEHKPREHRGRGEVRTTEPHVAASEQPATSAPQ